MTALIVFCAQYLVIIPPLIVVWVFWKALAAERRVMLLRGLLVMVLAVALAKGGGALYNDPRPFVVSHTTPLIPHAPDNGFPSDHTLLTFACAFLVLPFSLPMAGIAVLVAAAVGLARIACGLHFPLDVEASIVFAAMANAVAFGVIRPRPVAAQF